MRVIQHEYTHTVTLDQTKFRVPHWLTEAAAVSMEPAPRDFDTCMTLADSYRDGTLFDLDEIKWAFVRPQRPGDRGKAYAQGHWMVQFMNERFGPDALVRLLARYNAGDREAAAIPAALGISRAKFFQDFLDWAGVQVRAWGLDPEPSMLQLTDSLRWADENLSLIMAASRQARLDAIAETIVDRIGAPARPSQRPFTGGDWPPLMRPPVDISDEQLATWRKEYPDHPDLLRLDIDRRLEALGGPDESLVPMLERYAELRPVDMFPHRILAKLYLDLREPMKAAPHLEQLDVREEKTAVYAIQLARIYRDAGDTAAALEKVTRAANMDPYDAPIRELAAAIAIEAHRLDLARTHIKALTLIEPDRPQHAKRLKRIEEMLGK
jgi:Peptidase MA superfamily/Tetratricopeptide repeat